MTVRFKSLLVVAIASLTACGGDPAPKPTPAATPTAAGAPTADAAADINPGLLDPLLAEQTAPDQFSVKFFTTKGDFTVAVVRSWAPRGADRFYSLVQIGFYDDVAFFRVLGGFVAQFGIHGNPRISEVWSEARIPDDPTVHSNERGTLTYATAGPNTRTTQLFLNFGDNANLDGMGFAPFGHVVEGMEVVDSLYKEYGEGVDQGQAQSQGNEYLKRQFPELDYVKSVTVVP